MSTWWNRGAQVPDLALRDRGFLFGLRVMTTLLIEDGVAYDCDRHLDRLLHHADKLGLPSAMSKRDLQIELEAALLASDRGKFVCRLFLTAGLGALKEDLSSLHCWINVEPAASLQTVGSSRLALVTDSSWKRGEHIKTGFYHERMRDLHKAIKAGRSDVLWCNADQEIAECTTANIFLIGRDGDLVEIATPAVQSGILLGVTRRRMIDLLQAAQIPVTERIIYRDEIPRFDEAFTTSSLAGVVAIDEIGSHRLHSSRPTAVVGHILRLWNAWKLSQRQEYTKRSKSILL